MICVNAWLLWRRAVNLDSHLPLAEFKLEIAEVFTKSNAEDLAVLYSHNWRWKKKEIPFCSNSGSGSSNKQSKSFAEIGRQATM
jgi:hypothetical protein